MTCGLCENKNASPFYKDEKRTWNYFVCSECELVFRDPETYLDHEEEKKRYSTHDNNIENQGYVDFLMPNVKTLLPYLKKGAKGLDFGSGPGPILDKLFAEEDIEVKNYDPYFDYHPHLLDDKYDFITCTEAFEHFSIPFKEMVTMNAALKPGGFLLIMTEMYRDREHFASWGYRTDPTHICFLNKKGLKWMANQWGYEILSCDGRISLLVKNS